MSLRRVLSAIVIVVVVAAPAAADEATFFRGLNLNGPPVEIDGQQWEGQEASWYRSKDRAFENQLVELVPATDPERAKMIRSSRWGGNEVVLTDMPQGEFSIFLYVWEDNNPETFNISLNGREVLSRFNSGTAGQWKKLGPWIAENPADGGEIWLTSSGGAANFSGIEIWRGRHSGQIVTAEGLKYFEQHIRPLLVERCYECHASQAESIGGELRLDIRSGWEIGGTAGPAIARGNPDASLLIQTVRYHDDELQMPPDEKLPDDAIAHLTKWIEMGAPDPRDDSELVALKRDELLKSVEGSWAFTPPVDPPLPQVTRTDWPKNGIDHFILARLEKENLSPVADAERRALIRRATFDLTGLPPTPEDVAAFIEDEAPGAFERVVDRLLASPQYGERWGRYWLDVVRYADTAGDNSDFPIPQMHLYRDWVIDAINEDVPYDHFVKQQLAGDLLPAENDEQRRKQIIATGYIASARRFGSRVDDYPQHLTIEDTIDNLGRAFLGLTINCARCHDHKFDPLLTEDYYALYGIFSSTRYPWPGIELDQKQRDLVPLCSAEEAEHAMAQRHAKLNELKSALRKIEKERDDASGDKRKELDRKVEQTKRDIEREEKSPLPFRTAYAVAEQEKPADVAVQYKGDPTKTGPVVQRGFPLVLGGQKLAAGDKTSGRLSLAEWIVDRKNPLTARVMVNRLWTHHFGRGLVATPNDFGKQGKAPTHPELLDWLAHRFIESGWSMKAMHRLMMNSRTYQLAAIHDPTTIVGDPANDLLSGFRPRRLDAEAIRDTLLALSGTLDPQKPGPHDFPPMVTWKFTQHSPFKAVYPSNHRSVYLMTQRIQRHPYLAIFDGPDPSASTPVRLTSTTPLQALFLLNDPSVHEQAAAMAARMFHDQADEAKRVELAYQYLFARPPHEEEVAIAQDYLARTREVLKESRSAEKELELTAWKSYLRSLLLSSEFVYVD